MKNVKKWLLGALAALTAMPSMAATFVGDRTDFRDETIYFAMTTRFYDGDPKNNVCGWDHQNVQIQNNDPDWRGDFKGLIEKLDYIKALGFTAIWITPIVQNCSGTDFHGYHAMDFSKVDLRYESRTEWGSSEDVKFEDLIDAAHAKGMKIILDIVLNHTGNFGEAHFAELFYRSQDIRNQANVSASIIPNYDKLPSNYNELDGDSQYKARFPYLKNSDGTNKDNHNYWHHVGTGWNWDYPNRWWGQIAGDCVDLNTENPAVSKYLVECYGKFIEMGVDGFRIDTTGHISRLTFNTSFIPQFMALGEKYKNKRLNGAPFFMFGECCARFSDVTYRDQPNLSSYFYTWKSPEDLVGKWNWDETFWDNIYIKEGDDAARPGNMALCDAEPSIKRESDNVFMKNGAWHQPDYSDYSNFSIIDFPMHYNFNNAGAAVNVAKSGDKYYNDASFNVVYVDSHDYCPGPNDGTRFNGGTEQWAENLSLMFTFRGIPCIYYGSEVEFQAGQKVDAGGTDMPVKDSGRAYYGHYIEGNVSASDFGVFTASGNAATTLNGDLSQHIIRLNKIRAAVPALRKGQYTFDGCSAQGGWAFKRAYKDSYALVAINGGATFSNVPAGTYVDVVTGETYQGGGSITVNAPKNKGQLRVLVKDWKGGKIGEDGKFMYASSPVAKGGKPKFTDPGATEYYTADDAIGSPAVKFSHAGGSFRTETLTVTATLNEAATTGWIQVGNEARKNLTTGSSTTFTIGQGMNYGESVTVKWGADEYNGSVTYKKVDPNAAITVYVTGKDGADISGTNIHAWNDGGDLTGSWPGKTLTETTVVDGKTFYFYTFDAESVNVIFNRNGSQTGDIKGITSDTYFEYDGASSANEIDVNVTPVPSVRFSPNGGEFVDNVNVTVTVSNATSAWYKIGNGQQVTISGNSATFTLGDNMSINETVTVSWSATNGTDTKTGSVTYKKVEKQPEPEGITVFYDNSVTNWSTVKIHHWSVNETTWPGVDMTRLLDRDNVWMYTVPTGTTGIVFNNGNGDQTDDVENPEHMHLYKGLGNRKFSDEGLYEYNSISDIESEYDEQAVEYYNMQGMRVENPGRGFYIMRQGNKVQKVHIW
ncbi:MAG: alpha-amylase family glycosyl hydrolase [Bacteroidales bacterium]|nr:alpha-amylase family glycosyl hydrolase [Bacteroidales bacterium]